MNRFRYRQVFLFLVVLVLPTAAIIVENRRNAAQKRENEEQQRELAAKQQVELRNQTAVQIGREILAKLERIKFQEADSFPAGEVPESSGYSDPAVAFVGLEKDGRLIWPWNDGPTRDLSTPPVESDFARRIAQAERAEFGEKNYARAAALYREAVAAATSDAERASARLPLASALSRSGAPSEAIRAYRELLNLSSTLTDDQGLPFASYAALRLAESHSAEPEVLNRVKRDLGSTTGLSPTQAYHIRSVLEALGKSDNTMIREAAAAVAVRLTARINDLEQAQEIQESFPKLGVTSDAWQPYDGKSLWWIGKAAESSSRPLILAVRIEELRRSVEAERLARSAGPPFQIVTAGNSGEPLGEHLPGLRVVLGEVAEVATTAPDNPRSFYGLSLFLVVMFTFIGAFFLWRDTRRESRMAELRSQFVSSVSHELKTPLTSIRMFAESMQMDEEAGTGDPKERAEYLDTIVCETERLTRLLNNVLDFSRIERGQKNYHLQSEELPSVVGAALRTMRFPLAAQGFDLRLELCEDLPLVKVDRDAIEQAILNLLHNAMKYSGKSREIGLRLSRQNGSALIQVSDHGIGIPAGEQRRIFEKFYRVPSKENRSISGTGLGLSLVAHIAEGHGGAVDVKSTPGEGSTFSIKIPLSGNGVSSS